MIARGGVGLFLVPLFGFNAACFSRPDRMDPSR